MAHDPTVWLAASLVVGAVAVNAAWWAAAHGPPERAARIAAALAIGRWLYLGGVPLAAVGLGVAPLWLSGWISPAVPWVTGVAATAAAAAGAAAVVVPWRLAGIGCAVAGGTPQGGFALLGVRAGDVVLREAHWGLVRAGVVAAAPGWFALPGGAAAGVGQLAVLVLLVGEALANPWLRHAVADRDGAWSFGRLAAAAAASHLGWALGGAAVAGLAAHLAVAIAAAVVERGAYGAPPVPSAAAAPRGRAPRHSGLDD